VIQQNWITKMQKTSIVKIVGDIIGDLGRATHFRGNYERLNRLSDAQLAARGIARENVVRAAMDLTFAGR
jgi:hypothetical protein